MCGAGLHCKVLSHFGRENPSDEGTLAALRHPFFWGCKLIMLGDSRLDYINFMPDLADIFCRVHLV